jgi:hypothetical protein
MRVLVLRRWGKTKVAGTMVREALDAFMFGVIKDRNSRQTGLVEEGVSSRVKGRRRMVNGGCHGRGRWAGRRRVCARRGDSVRRGNRRGSVTRSRWMGVVTHAQMGELRGKRDGVRRLVRRPRASPDSKPTGGGGG